MELKEKKKLKKNLPRFFCEVCDFKCYMKCDWDRHILRPKHIDCVVGNSGEIKKLKKTYFCDCGKNFLSNSGLWKHKKVCDEEIQTNEPETQDKEIPDKELILMLVKQNSELLEVLKNGTTQNSNNTTTTTNSHNKAFNLQFFLNETCKDAMNITDFVDSIKLQMSDLLSVGELGYVKGISKIITASLKALDVSKRPVHCADQKREVVYIKDDDKWEREGEDKQKLKKAIRRVASKNQRLLPEFKAAYPDCMKSNSRYSDHYCKLIMEAMGGRGDNDAEKEAKIIRNITVASTIEK